VVELVLAEIETAHHRLDGAVARIDGDEGAFHLGQLRDLEGVLGRSRDADDRATPYPDVGWRLVGKARLRGLEAFPGDLEHIAVGAHRRDFPRVGLEHDGGHHVAVVGMLGERVVDGLVHFLGVIGQIDELLRAAIDLASLVVHDAPAQRLVCGGLIGGDERRVDLQAPGVGAVAVLGIHQLADRLGHVFGVQAIRIGRVAQMQFLQLGLRRLRGGDEAGIAHAIDHVELASACPCRIVDGPASMAACAIVRSCSDLPKYASAAEAKP
jgi:hypothetical protein